jgi:hypothetical protein
MIGEADRLGIDAMAASGDGPRRIRRYLQRQGYRPDDIEQGLRSLGLDPGRQGGWKHTGCRVLGVLVLLAGAGLFVYFLLFASATHFIGVGFFPFVALIGLIMIVVGEDWLDWVERLFGR